MPQWRKLLRAMLRCFARPQPQTSQARPHYPLPDNPVDRIHGEDDLVTFAPVQDGKVLSHAEHHFRDGAGLRTIRATGRAITGRGEIVPPEKVIGLCLQCGNYESIIYRCCRCDVVLCGGCVRRVATQTGEQMYCPLHLAEYQESLNTWRRE